MMMMTDNDCNSIIHSISIIEESTVYFPLQYALPHLRKTKGNIIQDSSLVAEIGQPGSCTYVATKVSTVVTLIPILKPYLRPKY